MQVSLYENFLRLYVKTHTKKIRIEFCKKIACRKLKLHEHILENMLACPYFFSPDKHFRLPGHNSSHMKR